MEQAVGDESFSADENTPFNSRVRITFYHKRLRLADPDGLSGKAAIDAIVANGILPDDSAKYVEEVRHFQVKGRPEETRVVIEEIDEATDEEEE